MSAQSPQRSISRKNLESHEIFYDEEVHRRTYPLPKHVDAVREILLSFDAILPGGGWKKTLDKELEKEKAFQKKRKQKQLSRKKPEEEDTLHKDLEQCKPGGIPRMTLQPPRSSWIPIASHEKDSNSPSPRWHAAYANLKECLELSKTAQSLELDAEDEWALFWRSKIFEVVSSKTRDEPGFIPLLDNWESVGNCTWTEFNNLNVEASNLLPRTAPKPDVTYAFPILKSSSREKGGYQRDTMARGFSVHALGTLREEGIICAPTKGLQRWNKNPARADLRKPDLACFPWAVIEFKRQEEGGVPAYQRCYCQAANASAAALDLRAQLFKRGVGDSSAVELSPIISFTCVGPIVKLWLTYEDVQAHRKRNMVCIWSTSIRLTWGIAALRAVIKNMHTWASRLLKPKLQLGVLQALKYSRSKDESNLCDDINRLSLDTSTPRSLLSSAASATSAPNLMTGVSTPLATTPRRSKTLSPAPSTPTPCTFTASRNQTQSTKRRSVMSAEHSITSSASTPASKLLGRESLRTQRCEEITPSRKNVRRVQSRTSIPNRSTEATPEETGNTSDDVAEWSSREVVISYISASSRMSAAPRGKAVKPLVSKHPGHDSRHDSHQENEDSSEQEDDEESGQEDEDSVEEDDESDGESETDHEANNEESDYSGRDNWYENKRPMNFDYFLKIRYIAFRPTQALELMTGQEIASIHCLRDIYESQTEAQQLELICDVLGPGKMDDDRYIIGEKKWLERIHKICESNGMDRATAFRRCMNAAFMKRELESWDSFDRWCFFRNALSIRSQEACDEILRAYSFVFTFSEWAALEDSSVCRRIKE
ncbi:hypothetical protein IQ07DRAFT_680569 [Pyrenochaeta sp. DS3sAY3a]|nr:hypothetical protein IQ07DRAFT_680569 [Pyrenochaeta sp. DS3sAY3a]